MTSREIRQSFLDFFEQKGHRIVPSASLLPDAPNLLFTNAGMNPFVPYFLGERAPTDRRIADTQKCIRAGGKHNDLDDVGFDSYHHTFFEMLGNWSIGDYFKKEIIHWAWELLTGVWKFPKERLYATVYQPGEGDPADFDQEAWDLWAEIFRSEGLDPAKHIVHGNKKDNFWMMGETGPCGPCSEIHIDLTPNGDTAGKLVNQDSPLCIEIWNLVFIQFNACEDGSFVPLREKHVDTGMGFERIAGILASTKNLTDFSTPSSNYDSDLFTPIFAKISEMSGHSYGGRFPTDRAHLSPEVSTDCAFRVLADHIRTLSCSLADGILPGNEGRNYVLRRILRRACMFGNRLGLKTGFFSELSPVVVEILGPVFPELREKQDLIRRVILREEETFGQTLDRGMQLLEKCMDQPGKAISGKDAFLLYDTYGFPLDLTELIASGRGFTVDTAGFESAMEQQRQRARNARKTEVIAVASESDVEGTRFCGFDSENLVHFPTTLQEVATNGDQTYLIFPETPFYAEMGGQVGDRGQLTFSDGTEIAILNTLKDPQGRFLHQVEHCPAERTGETLHLSVDTTRRGHIQRHHTATHILHHFLRQELGDHVRQAGSYVGEDRLRFDFTHFEAVSPESLRKVEQACNQAIMKNDALRWYEVPFDEKPDQCIAFFGEKYGDVVRVVDLGGWSVELCGGTHVQSAGEIGPMILTLESGIAAGTRRIEAVCGSVADNWIRRERDTLRELAHRFSCQPTEVAERVKLLSEQKAQLERELKEKLQQENLRQAETLAAEAKTVAGFPRVAAKVSAHDANSLRQLGSEVLNRLASGVVVLIAEMGPKLQIVALCSKDAIQAGIKAGDLVRSTAAILRGSGGGKPDFAMGGAKDASKIPEVLEALHQG